MAVLVELDAEPAVGLSDSRTAALAMLVWRQLTGGSNGHAGAMLGHDRIGELSMLWFHPMVNVVGYPVQQTGGQGRGEITG